MAPNLDFSIRSFLGGYDKNFTYLITCIKSNSQVLIDASIDPNHILPFIRNHPIALLITHTHSDHIAYLDRYLEIFKKITVIAHPKALLNMKYKSNLKLVKDMQNFRIDNLIFQSIHTPGHYFDSICYQLNPTLFTGDTLFVGRTGRTISTKSSIYDLYDSIYNKILMLPKNIRIYPGHDYGKKPSIQLNENITISPLLQAKDRNDFINVMNKYEKNRKYGE